MRPLPHSFLRRYRGGLVQAVFAPPFNPLDGSPIALYDPSDVATLWKDTAGTSAVTAAWDQVAREDDQSGNGNHVTQATANIRPLWDGTSKLNFFWGTDTTTRIAYIRDSVTTAIPRAGCSGGVVFDAHANTAAPILDLGTSQLAFVLGGAGNFNTLRVFNGAYVDTGLVFAGRRNVLTWRSNGDGLYVTLNGVSATLAAQSAVNMTLIHLGVFNGGLPKSCKIRYAVIYGTDIGATDQAALGTYMQALVGTPDETRTVCVIADSLGAGVGSEQGRCWHDYITNRATSRWYVFARDGAYSHTALPIPAASAAALKGSAEGVYLLCLGINGINSGARTGLQVAADNKSYAATLRAAGGLVIVHTLPDCPNNEAERLACNAQILADAASYDAIVDLAAAPELDDCTDTTYFTSDQVHEKDAGQAAWGSLTQTAMAAL